MIKYWKFLLLIVIKKVQTKLNKHNRRHKLLLYSYLFVATIQYPVPMITSDFAYKEIILAAFTYVLT